MKEKKVVMKPLHDTAPRVYEYKVPDNEPKSFIPEPKVENKKTDEKEAMGEAHSVVKSRIDARHDDIQQLTAEYILALINDGSDAIEEQGIDAEMLDEIIDAFEGELYKYGILIDHPALIDSSDGVPLLVNSIYEDEMGYDEWN